MHFMFDQEKIVDFFTLNKKEFLSSYSYLTDEDYEATVRAVIKTSGYQNPETCEGFEGNELKDIVLGCMMTEWLSNKEV